MDKNEIQHIDREKCDGCGVYSEFCPTSALKLVRRTISLDELMRKVERDVKLYDDSGGVVTFSGRAAFPAKFPGGGPEGSKGTPHQHRA
ncbi:Pyruvate formate-lyase activating enzyme [Thermococcus sp. 2319x1]|uniref:hypothetical protein n=1 Tax=Thermococcus sp. 2319x1 TaxID=1674923 RepID=UPI00073AC010|nr:hypothetical protein [Thermococcus sp. 2319x1]ALV62695.1 Pyruvate formate-lyase activating enzyme [Thermococcus sp. 2319x1]